MMPRHTTTTLPDGQMTLDDVPADGVDAETAAVLELVAGDQVHADDRRRIVDTIRADAQGHGGHVSSNRVRVALTGEHGLTVYPRLIGAIYSQLARAHVLTADGWEVSDDLAGGNRGKPVRTWYASRWTR